MGRLNLSCTLQNHCAAAMGHTLSTHLDFYGSYTTELAIEKAFERHAENRIEV